jgi:hypothetical protein
MADRPFAPRILAGSARTGLYRSPELAEVYGTKTEQSVAKRRSELLAPLLVLLLGAGPSRPQDGAGRDSGFPAGGRHPAPTAEGLDLGPKRRRRPARQASPGRRLSRLAALASAACSAYLPTNGLNDADRGRRVARRRPRPQASATADERPGHALDNASRQAPVPLRSASHLNPQPGSVRVALAGPRLATSHHAGRLTT